MAADVGVGVVKATQAKRNNDTTSNRRRVDNCKTIMQHTYGLSEMRNTEGERRKAVMAFGCSL